MDRTKQLQLRAKAYKLYKKDMVDVTKTEDFKTFLEAEYQVKWYIESLLVDKKLIETYHEDLREQSNEIETLITRKRNAAEGMFRIMYRTESERLRRSELLDEVQYQIEVCEGFCRSVPEQMVKEWLQLKSAIRVQNKAHDYKMSAFRRVS